MLVHFISRHVKYISEFLATRYLVIRLVEENLNTLMFLYLIVITIWALSLWILFMIYNTDACPRKSTNKAHANKI